MERGSQLQQLAQRGVVPRVQVQLGGRRAGRIGKVGSVEVVAEGDRKTLENLLAAMQRGPRISNVTQVDQEWGPASGEFRSFQVKSSF